LQLVGPYYDNSNSNRNSKNNNNNKMVLFFSQDFKKIENCADNVKSSFGKIASLAVTGDAGRSSQGSLLANGAKYNIT